ncbi:S1 family peptidase [Pararobbsia silviterrae]|uniref:Serine protease n=1 Tax=Pararobbsia silviterrae TaxID=1792498 RepID=A0A494XFN9_9BURK|nr:serine protease [Pararobbsia silviterrae]RKP49565.1 serine protease [Pararobbsia silviterrae]
MNEERGIVKFYSSSNGDEWLLSRTQSEGLRIKHVPNQASGGVVSEMSLETFLSGQNSGPEHETLRDLISMLNRPGVMLNDSPHATHGIAASNSEPFEENRGDLRADSLLLAVVRIKTFRNQQVLTNASGFFFKRSGRLFLATSRHVLCDEASRHLPDSLQIELHIDNCNLGQSVWFSIPLYSNEQALWRQAEDDEGTIDVAVVEINRNALPESAFICFFEPEHLVVPRDAVEIGSSILIVGFPLGFHDTLHHLAVARQGVLASAFGFRFQGKGVFVTDARMHRGTSGAPVVVRVETLSVANRELPWALLGVHSSSIDMSGRDLNADDSLGLNSAWYAEVLMTLTRS